MCSPGRDTWNRRKKRECVVDAGRRGEIGIGVRGGRRPGWEGSGRLPDGQRHAMCVWQGRLQSQDLGKHLAGVEDLLQLHELVEADIAVQAERVRAVSASALRFCRSEKGENWGKELGRSSKSGRTWGQAAYGWVVGDRAKGAGWGSCNWGCLEDSRGLGYTALDCLL